MATNKRISGDYNIQTLNVGDEITLTTSNVVVNANLIVNSSNIATANLSATVITAGNITSTGNVTANAFYGNGAGLTGVVAIANIGVATQLINGTTSLEIPLSGGNIFGNVNGVANVLILDDAGLIVSGYVNSNTVSAIGNVFSGNLITTGNISGNTLLLSNGISATGNIQGGNVTTAGLVSATGNIQGGNIRTAGLVSASGNIQGDNASLIGVVIATGNVQGGNITTNGIVTAAGNIQGGNIRTAGLISATGNIITAATLLVNSTSGTVAINNSGSNGVGNIGTASSYFNTLFARATSAQYADLAECYSSDADYEPGTVVMFGGSAEVTQCNQDACPAVAGVISASPAYKMNSGLDSKHVATVALVGRVPVKVQGPVNAGAMMVSAGNGQARAEANPAMGTVIGKAVQSSDGGHKTIEIVVGRL